MLEVYFRTSLVCSDTIVPGAISLLNSTLMSREAHFGSVTEGEYETNHPNIQLLHERVTLEDG
jgi:hypothetical protein